MTNAHDFQTVVNGKISSETMVALLDRWDSTRDFMVQFWQNNPKMAKQGGNDVLDLIEPIEQVQARYAATW